MTVLAHQAAGELRDADAVDAVDGDQSQSPAPLRHTLDKVFVRADVPLFVWVFR